MGQRMLDGSGVDPVPITMIRFTKPLHLSAGQCETTDGDHETKKGDHVEFSASCANSPHGRT